MLVIRRRITSVTKINRPFLNSVRHQSWWFNPDDKKKPTAEKEDENKVKAEAADADTTPNDDSSTIAPVLALQGAPRHPTILALPLDRKPLFPGLLHPIQITDRKVYQALVRARASGNPYIGLFLRKYDVAARDFVDVLPSEQIASMSEVHEIGTFAQILQMENFGPAMLASSDSHPIEESNEEEQYENPMFNSIGSGNSPARIMKELKEESWTIVVKAHRRIQIEEIINPGPPPLVKVRHLNNPPLTSYDQDTIRAYTNEVVTTLRDVVKHNPLLREHMQFFSSRFDLTDPHHVCNLAASLTSADGNELQEILDAPTLDIRLPKVLSLLKKEVELNRLQEHISKQVEETISANQRKYFLHEQLKQIKKELGLEHDDKDALLSKFRQKLDLKLNPPVNHEKEKKKEERKYVYGEMPKETQRVIEEEMQKLSTLEKTSPEFNVTRAYLDWLLSLPWGKCTEEKLDVKVASDILEADHFGLSDIKERILEFIAVGNLRGTVEGKIILLVGPPGVGKTSIGKSIAHALDRDFYRFSVGGLSDVSEIKGHRRTYIGSMPGKLIQCLKQTGVSNPVVLIDEIDKLGSGYRGDPASALLELLDPAQNSSFVDHYIDIPVDLSKVLFVCTANSLDTIPGPLLDRMEVLRLSGYDLPEKVAIAKQYLEPRAKESCGLSVGKSATDDEKKLKLDRVPANITIDEGAIESLARWYCREAGVRKLQQSIERVYRKLALEILKADGSSASDIVVTADKLEKYVGKPRYQSDKLYDDIPPPGVVMGLAWSTSGGSALYIETTCIRRSALETGDEKKKPRGPAAVSVHVTGQLGDVMKESSSIALTYSRHLLQEIDSCNSFFDDNQIHLHVPEGSTPKDGPSAGVTMVTALMSLATNTSVKANLAMTGEIGLTGMVLPIGGVKEKVIAARRSGVTTIVLPDGNRKDADELPQYLKDGLDIHFAKTYEDVYKVAFEKN